MMMDEKLVPRDGGKAQKSGPTKPHLDRRAACFLSSTEGRRLQKMLSTPSGFRTLALPVAQLSLPAVLKCGQSFRWQTHTFSLSEAEAHGTSQEWRLALSDRVVCLRQSPTTLFYRSLFPQGASTVDADAQASTLAWLRDYFQLDIDLVKLYEEWSAKDPVFRGIAPRFPGIRMLRQDPWENVISWVPSVPPYRHFALIFRLL
jgi:N-glycosylase/DNA lyase